MNLKSILILIVIISLAVPSTEGIGLRAPVLKDTFFFSPNLEKNYDISFATNSGRTMDYELYVRMETNGVDLTEYVELDKYYVESVPTSRLVPFKIKIKFPSSIDESGIHEIRVGVKEVATGSGTVSGLTASEMRIIVNVLHPGNKIESKFIAPNANIDETMNFEFRIQNLGTLDSKASGEIAIFDSQDALIGSAISETKTVLPTKTASLNAPFNTEGLLPATYTARAKLRWHGNVDEFEKQFRVGDKGLKITKVTEEALTSAINKFKISVESGWNNVLSQVHVEVRVRNENKKTVTSFKTPSLDIEPWKTKEFLGYLDTSNLPEGKYTSLVDVFYEGDILTKEFPLVISKEAETEVVEEIPDDGSIDGPSTIEILLTVIIVLMIMLLFTLFIMLKKSSRFNQNNNVKKPATVQKTLTDNFEKPPKHPDEFPKEEK